MNNNSIELYRDGGIWMAMYCGAHAALVEDLFSTNSIPTAFDASVSFEEVRKRISNERYEVHCRHRNTSTVFGVGAILCDDCGMRW